MGYEQRVISQFLLREKAHSTQIHRKFAAQYGLETYSLRSVPIGVNSLTVGAKTYTMSRGPEAAIDHLDAKILVCLEREPFASAYSLAKALHVWPATDRLA
jgi:hypothetical protein